MFGDEGSPLFSLWSIVRNGSVADINMFIGGNLCSFFFLFFFPFSKYFKVLKTAYAAPGGTEKDKPHAPSGRDPLGETHML